MFLLGIPGEHPEGISAVGSEGTAADACAHPSDGFPSSSCSYLGFIPGCFSQEHTAWWLRSK